MTTRVARSTQASHGCKDACAALLRQPQLTAVPGGANRFKLRACTIKKRCATALLVSTSSERAGAKKAAEATVEIRSPCMHSPAHHCARRLGRGRRRHVLTERKVMPLICGRVRETNQPFLPFRRVRHLGSCCIFLAACICVGLPYRTL